MSSIMKQISFLDAELAEKFWLPTCQIPGDRKVYDERDPACLRATVS